MAERSFSRRVEVRVPSRDFANGVRTALERLGYDLIPVSVGAPAPDVRIVAGSRLRRLPEALSEPVILIGGNPYHDDPRVVGILQRPARLLDLYILLQEAVEPSPRSVPRISTALPARGVRGGTDRSGSIVSLSERGCCLRTTEALPGDGNLQLEFTLPSGGLVNTSASPRYRTHNNTGLMFDRLPEISRSAISEFINHSLTARV